MIKRILITLILAVSLLFCHPIANKAAVKDSPAVGYMVPDNGKHNYTYEGDIDPATLFSWKVVKHQLWGDGTLTVWVSNPKDAEPRFVQIANRPGEKGKWTIVGYTYLIDGVRYLFMLNKENHYEQKMPIKI